MPARPVYDRQYATGLGVVLGLALVSLLVHAWHVVGEEAMPMLQMLLGVVFPTAMALLLLGVGLWFHQSAFDPAEMLTLGAWAGMGFLVFVWVSGGAMLYYLVQDVLVYDPLVVTVTIGSAGALAGSLIGVYDVRGRRARADYRTQRDRAEQLTERLSILNRVFRHDIRTELTVIRGNARLATEQCEGSIVSQLETVRERAEAIEALSERARTLQATVDRATEHETQDVCDLLHALKADLEASHSGTSISVSGPGQAVVEASVNLEAAIEEVLENAIEHGDREGIEVAVDRGADMVEIVVRDWGPGIPEAEIEIIDSAVETPLQHSSGMGLWTVKWIIEASDGTFEIEAVDSGTSVVMELPRTDSG